jgi:hypothetical protein
MGFFASLTDLLFIEQAQNSNNPNGGGIAATLTVCGIRFYLYFNHASPTCRLAFYLDKQSVRS